LIKIIKNISIYSLGNILLTGISFILLPLYTRILSPSDYGQLELLYLIAGILVLLFGFNVSIGYGRIYFNDKNIKSRRTLFMTGQAFILICSAIFILILFNNINYFSRIIFDSDIGNYFLKLITIATVIDVLTQIPINNLRVRKKAWSYIQVSILTLVVTVLFTIYFIAFIDLGVVGVLYGKILGSLISLIYLYYLTWNEFHFRLSNGMLLSMLSFSIFLIPSNFSSLVLNMSNRFFLSEYQTFEDVGLFSLGVKIAAVIPMLITEPIKNAFSPYIFEIADQPNKCKELLSDFIRLFFAGVSIFVLIVSIFASDLVSIMASDSFQGSSSVVFVMSFSNLLLGTAAIVVLAIHITRKTWIVSIIWIFSSLLNITLNILLIPIYSKMGAAYATLLSILFILIFYIISAKKVFPIIIPYRSMLKVVFLLISFNYLSGYISFDILTNIFFKICILLLYIMIMLNFTRIIKKDEIKLIKKYLNI
tara:strand:- start:1332 stop:2768 length:1437 start_codon:yes stop_codon:yes gene_type:complete